MSLLSSRCLPAFFPHLFRTSESRLPYGFDSSYTQNNTISPSDQNKSPHGPFPDGQGYTINYNRSYASDNTMSSSDRAMYTTPHGPSPDGQAYTKNYDRSYASDNTRSPSDRTTPHGPSQGGQAHTNYNREPPPTSSSHHEEYLQSHPSNTWWSKNPSNWNKG